MTENQGEEHGCSKAVGSMTGEESVHPSPISVDHIHQIFYTWCMGGTESVEIRLE